MNRDKSKQIDSLLQINQINFSKLPQGKFHPIVKLVSSNNVIAFGRSDFSLTIANVNNDTVNSFKIIDNIPHRSDDTFENLFVDISGRHLIFTTALGESFYLNCTTFKYSKLSRWQGSLESVAFGREIEGETELRPFLVGTTAGVTKINNRYRQFIFTLLQYCDIEHASGMIYEINIDKTTAQERSRHVVLQLEQPLAITSIFFDYLGHSVRFSQQYWTVIFLTFCSCRTTLTAFVSRRMSGDAFTYFLLPAAPRVCTTATLCSSVHSRHSSVSPAHRREAFPLSFLPSLRPIYLILSCRETSIELSCTAMGTIATTRNPSLSWLRVAFITDLSLAQITGTTYSLTFYFTSISNDNYSLTGLTKYRLRLSFCHIPPVPHINRIHLRVCRTAIEAMYLSPSRLLFTTSWFSASKNISKSSTNWTARLFKIWILKCFFKAARERVQLIAQLWPALWIERVGRRPHSDSCQINSHSPYTCSLTALCTRLANEPAPTINACETFTHSSYCTLQLEQSLLSLSLNFLIMPSNLQVRLHDEDRHNWRIYLKKALATGEEVAFDYALKHCKSKACALILYTLLWSVPTF